MKTTFNILYKFLLSETLPLFRKSQLRVLRSSLTNGNDVSTVEYGVSLGWGGARPAQDTEIASKSLFNYSCT